MDDELAQIVSNEWTNAKQKSRRISRSIRPFPQSVLFARHQLKCEVKK
jgi:hypothetical protein